MGRWHLQTENRNEVVVCNTLKYADAVQIFGRWRKWKVKTKKKNGLFMGITIITRIIAK